MPYYFVVNKSTDEAYRLSYTKEDAIEYKEDFQSGSKYKFQIYKIPKWAIYEDDIEEVHDGRMSVDSLFQLYREQCVGVYHV